jgi:PHD/YefM family antitoxin component YafN of YafNO toxin-antitoxin module
MEFVSVRDFRTSPKRIWSDLQRDGKLVITNNGKPAAVMIGVDGSNLEETLLSIRQSEAMRLVNKLRLQAVRSGVSMSMDEIDQTIHDIRNRHE